MTAAAPSLVCDLEYDRSVNYAIQQNHVPVVKRLHVSNVTAENLEGLTVTLSSDPEFAAPWVRRIDRLPAGETVDMGTVDLELSASFLRTLSERVAGSLMLGVSQDGAPLYSQSSPITVLAYDEWNGVQTVPEIIAAFVTPNLPAVAHFLKRASEILGQWTNDSAMDAYQSRDPGRVRMQLGAIFAAIRKEEIGYCMPPASFEETGQRIRLPDTILKQRLATCLDFTVLFAACVEAAGLHPLVVFMDGHAFPGAWLVDESFPESVQDDATLITRRSAAGIQEIVVVESTAMASGQTASFDDAVTTAEMKLREPGQFYFFVDISRARTSQIRPVPISVDDTGDQAGGITTVSPRSMPPPTAVRPPVDAAHGADAGRSLSRTEQWERRLLDLSLRNPLLNFRTTATSLRLLLPDSALLEDAIAEGREFQVFPRPVEWAASPRDPSVYRQRDGGDPVGVLLKEELGRGRLRADLDEKELPTRLTQLYRASRTSLEETGANSLYLSLGMLLWFEDAKSHKARYAPILLLPMEIVRRSVQSGYVFRIREDEPQLNVTLLEMLRQDFEVEVAGLETLPLDEHGVDVEKVLALFRRAILQQPRWDVHEDAYLGLFSFSKFVMWRDIRVRSADLQRSPIVAGLVSRDGAHLSAQLSAPRSAAMPGQGPANASAEPLPSPSTLDASFTPADLLCPISADSSQLAAVAAASQGRSFVLHGPPGTGKSQTITNIIANELGRGKTVLFVAEKMAALSVVQRRLEQMGLGPFCLELHSSKSRKKDVIDQLGLALKVPGEQPPPQWEAEADRLSQLRSHLNGYASALHRERPSGFTLFEAVSRLADLQGAPVIAFDTGKVSSLTAAQFQTGKGLARQLRVVAENCGGPHNHPWTLSGRQDYTPSLQLRATEALAHFRRSVEHWQAAVKAASERLHVAAGEPDYRELCTIRAVAALWLNGPVPAALLRAPDWDEMRSFLGSCVTHGRARDALRKDLYVRFQPEVVSVEAAELQAALKATDSQWFLPRFLGRRRVYGILRGLLQPGETLSAEQVDEDLTRIESLRQEAAAILNVSDRASRLLGSEWQEGEADWDTLTALFQRAGELRHAAAVAAGGNPAGAAALWEEWAKLSEACAKESWLPSAPTPAAAPAPPAAAPVQAAPESLFALHGLGGAIPSFETGSGQAVDSGQRPRADDCIRECAAAGDAVIAAWKDLGALLAFEDRALTDCASRGSSGQAPAGWFPAMLGRIDLWERSLDSLRDWCAWRRVRSDAAAAGLNPLIAACEAGTLCLGDFEAAYERGVYTAWLEAEISRDPLLSSFQRVLFEDIIHQFRETDEMFTNLTRRELFARLASRIPHLSDTAAPHSEVGILKREMLKQRNHIALRALFGKIPNLLSRLKPCLLMSPMSVAQYLDPAHPPFDLVVFDEASQVPTCDAVGALARGSQAVIVGDPKQLPPTSFFGPGGGDADPETESLQDLESILDDVLAISLPEEHLRWHYRSRHEGLIAFSNRLYYQNGLLTFPSPDDLEPAVKWRPIDGVYDRGGARQNRAEAEAVATEVVRRLNDPALQKQSIGIVTFSSPQQRLVEDILDERLRQNPALERFFAPDLIEPVFVKNLENVQGDERDVILFSIGYGPDSAGRMSMNFGPLNQLGGPRRLNVAVTRARTEMMVFSTLRADQLDLSRTSAQGVADLKAFLEYAERGKLPLDLGTAALSAGSDAGLEHEIALALRRRGHTVHTRVGSSGYRLDLAVVDPACPGRYLIGIETDGAMYRQAGTARDRDKLRQMILAQLGWTLHRVWAMEWWSDPARELRRIEEAIAMARAAAGVSAPAVPPSEGASPAAAGTPGSSGAGAVRATASQGASTTASSPTAASTPTPGGASQGAVPPPAPAPIAGMAGSGGAAPFIGSSPGPFSPGSSPAGTSPAVGSPAAVPQPGPQGAAKPYRRSHLPPPAAGQDDFYMLSTTAMVASQIEKVIAEEGPVSFGLLSRRVAGAWGMARVGSRVEARLQEVCHRLRPVTTKAAGTTFLWPRELNPALYTGYRTPGQDPDERRGPQDLPPQEIANAIADVVRCQISLPEADLVREVARVFGFQRTGAAVDASIRQGLALALKNGKVHQSADGRIVGGQGAHKIPV